MLTSLSLRNFKSWANSGELRLAPITGLFGTNSSGKSSILQLLLLLKQTIESSDPRPALDLGTDGRGGLVNLGTFQDVIFGHDTTQDLTWQLAWQPPESALEASFISRYGNQLSLAVSVGKLPGDENGPISVQELCYGFGHGGQAGSIALERMQASPLSYRADLTGDAESWGPFPFEIVTAPRRFYGFPPGIADRIADQSPQWQFPVAVEEEFGRVSYLGPLRVPPERLYIWGGRVPSDVGRDGENTVAALLANEVEASSTTTTGAAFGQSAIQLVRKALDALGMAVDFGVPLLAPGSNVYQVRVRHTSGAPEVLLPDVGLGVSQVLPVLTLLYYVPEGSIVLLEHPEVHLHPSAQSALADVLIDAVSARHLQVILESHSEHLLRRLQRRIAEGTLQAEQTALYFCELRDGASHAVPLKLDQYGFISNWPPSFFGDELGELAAMTSAAMQRQMSGAA